MFKTNPSYIGGTNCQVYTEEKLDEDGTILEHYPQKSLRYQALENGSSSFNFTTFPPQKKELQHMN
jgi:hypothetical protein